MILKGLTKLLGGDGGGQLSTCGKQPPFASNPCVARARGLTAPGSFTRTNHRIRSVSPVRSLLLIMPALVQSRSYLVLIGYVVHASEDCASRSSWPPAPPRDQECRPVSVVALPASDVEDAGILDGERRSRASEGVMRSDLIHDQYIYINGLQCYECSTHDNEQFCADPFNDTHPDLRKSVCYGACAKWVRKPPNGSLNLHMPVTLVCMSESRPGDGRLCFCKTPLCNSAPPSGLATNNLVVTLLLSLVALLLASRCMPGCVPVAHAARDAARDGVNSRDLVVSRTGAWRQHAGRNYVTDANAG
ncbi:hypothetical protein NP493_244g02000 [Ridgeia piscesae]|uniref:Protein quiver n=1 Tax=Ridgeia piscesae TaxID=27915 RepID=A0AAD9NZ91_RIDPI|nr:hypothetical protein NP493_244g02000 [Ridgeia piscesae]